MSQFDPYGADLHTALLVNKVEIERRPGHWVGPCPKYSSYKWVCKIIFIEPFLSLTRKAYPHNANTTLFSIQLFHQNHPPWPQWFSSKSVHTSTSITTSQQAITWSRTRSSSKFWGWQLLPFVHGTASMKNTNWMVQSGNWRYHR